MEILLTTLGIMTRGPVEEFGCFHYHLVTVVDQQGNIWDFSTLLDYTPSLAKDLLGWTKGNEVQVLICSCVR